MGCAGLLRCRVQLRSSAPAGTEHQAHEGGRGSRTDRAGRKRLYALHGTPPIYSADAD